MNDFFTNGLKYKEIPSKPQEKDPYHHHIWDFVYFYSYGHHYLAYLPWKFLSKFFLEKVWLKNTLPTVWTYVWTFVAAGCSLRKNGKWQWGKEEKGEDCNPLHCCIIFTNCHNPNTGQLPCFLMFWQYLPGGDNLLNKHTVNSDIDSYNIK